MSRKTNKKEKVNNNRQSYRNNKKDNKRTGVKDLKEDVKMEKSFNNIKYWNKIPQLMEAAGNIGYSDVIGLPLEGLYVGSLANLQDINDDRFYPLAVLKYTETFGISDSLDSPVNVAAQAIYSFIRHKNSGSRNYEFQDYMTYVMAIRSLYSYYGMMAKVYGLFNTWSARNRMIAKPIVQALGFNYDDLANQLADFRAYINLFAVKVNSFCVPKEFDIYDRSIELPLHVYKDADTDKASLYTFMPSGFYKWTGTKYETGSALEWTEFSPDSGAYGLEEIMNFGDQLISAMYYNEDIGLMSGDTQKAFGEVRELKGIDTSFATLPVYDQGMLAQIHHAKPVGYVATGVYDGDGTYDTADIYQTPKYGIVYHPCLAQNFGSDPWILTGLQDYDAIRGLPDMSNILDCGHDNPSVEYNIEATRLMCTVGYQITETDESTLSVKDCGTEFINDIILFNPNISSGHISYVDDVLSLSNAVFSAPTAALLSNIQGYVNYLTRTTQFDWFPLIALVKPGALNVSNNDYSKALLFGDFYNYTVLNNKVLKYMHQSCLFSILNIPAYTVRWA